MVHHLARFFLRYVLQKNVRQREYYLNKFWDVRYPKSTEFFKLKLKVLMNFGVCMHVCVVLDMDVISLDILKALKIVQIAQVCKICLLYVPSFSTRKWK